MAVFVRGKRMGHFTCNFISYSLNRSVTVNVILPTLTCPEIFAGGKSHEVKKKYPVLYLLHGGINDYSSWERYTSIERYAEERRIAVVTFSSENKCYMDIDASGKENPIFGHDHLYTFASEELPDFVTSIFPISKDPEHTYIAGLSMGGMGTLTCAMNHPDRYRAIGVLSATACDGSIGGEAISSDTRYNTEALMRRHAEAGTKLPALYTAMGGNDWGMEGYRKWLSKMEELKIPYTVDIVPGYGHEWAFWDMEIQKFLDWLPRTDEYYLDSPIRDL